MTRRERNQSRKGTKRALTSSILAIALCVVLLAGATFAWFTDTASTKISKIEAGTLKVDIVDSKGTSVQGKTLAFTTADNREEILWEPGATYKLPEVKVVNNGNLALKYKVVFTAVEGDQSLAEALEIGTIVDGAFESTQNTLADALNPTNPDGSDDTDGFAHGNLAADSATEPMTFALRMKTTAGNEYQGKSISGLTISVLATQNTVEKDSYGDQYDKDATLDMLDAETVGKFTTGEYENKIITGQVFFDQKGIGSEGKLTFQNCIFLGQVGGRNSGDVGNVEFINCTFIGTVHLNDLTWRVDTYEGASKTDEGATVLFDGCHFGSSSVFRLASGAQSVTIKSSTFEAMTTDFEGDDLGLLLWSGVTFENCDIVRPLKIGVGSGTNEYTLTDCTNVPGSDNITNASDSSATITVSTEGNTTTVKATAS